MKEIKYTLLSDGSSDKRLIPILDWLLNEHCPELTVQSEWADFSRLPQKPKTLEDKIQKSIELYPCNILFIHRDAEGISHEQRIQEIIQAVKTVSKRIPEPPSICVVPVRMQEAWILFDEPAIRKAAGNPNGKIKLTLPDFNTIETLSDPKGYLMDLLISASGLKGRHLEKLKRDIHKKAYLVAENIENFALLKNLPAFMSLENDLKEFINNKKWG
ncbi:hypothetical protein [Candidatus Magnetomonas plexicatena]|uniref:hypothetical protein n=1 Tax=Candidatus Magnetomonas plexicatena TaxID=2552947 RepID=UPI001C7917C3|nr:hypothetical protein E2O03_007730 [Nitrospirales bacterium LBB_01]